MPGSTPRHPTPLYEALLEGVVLFVLLYPAALCGRGLNMPGRTTGLFLCGYALFRIPIEAVRVDYDPLRSMGLPASLAQVLCVPMFLLGAALLARGARLPASHET
jgi:phosphatidylglycerol:prolipoprotein diacylglycerol transferase